MTIDLSREPPVPLGEVPKLPWIPRRRGGRRLHVATVHRWCTHGLRGLRFEFVQLGGTRVTTAAALMRFFERLAGSEDGHRPPPTRHRFREVEAAAAAADSLLNLKPSIRNELQKEE